MIDHSTIVTFDRQVDQLFERIRGNRAADTLFYAASNAGDMSTIWMVIGTCRVLVRREPLENIVRLGAVLATESLLINQGLKRLFGRARPEFGTTPRPRRRRTPSTTSFPSGHSTSSMVAAALLSQHSDHSTSWYTLAAIVAASRIHVREHHASDVVGGLVIGGALGIVARRVLPQLPRRF